MARAKGWLLVAVVAVVGGYAAYWVARPAGWSAPGTALFVAAVTGLLVLAIGGWVGVVAMFTYRKVAQSGIQAPGAIVDVWRTGSVTHDQGEVRSELRLVVEVVPPNGDRYRARTKTLVTTAEEDMYRPGAAVEVRFHPDLPRKVFVAGIYSPGPEDGYASPPK